MSINVTTSPVVLLPGAVWINNPTRTFKVWGEDNQGRFRRLRKVIGSETATGCVVRPRETIGEAINRLRIKRVYVKCTYKIPVKGILGRLFRKVITSKEVRIWDCK